jgi:hypothetical protein
MLGSSGEAKATMVGITWVGQVRSRYHNEVREFGHPIWEFSRNESSREGMTPHFDGQS